MKKDLDISDLPGQLWPAERNYLREVVRSKKPKIILEVGCGCGAGSTYAMAKAIRESNYDGTIFACDIDENRLKQAKDLFKPWPFVHIRNCTGYVLAQWVTDCNRIPDLIFFDGPEDPEIAVRDLMKLEQRIKDGTHFLMHDWDLDKSQKAEQLRPRLESHPNWQKIHCLTAPTSVGLCHYRFVKK